MAGGIGGGALLVSLVVDLAGAHYLISKNEMPALAVLLVAAGCGLAAGTAGGVGTLVSAVAFLALPVAVVLTPSMQRPDYRDAAAALGPRAADQLAVVPRLGDAPVEHLPPRCAAADGGPAGARCRTDPHPPASRYGRPAPAEPAAAARVPAGRAR